MSYEPKDNTGSVWVNDKKEKDSHPDRTGTAVIGGVTYYVSGWAAQDAGWKTVPLPGVQAEGQA